MPSTIEKLSIGTVGAAREVLADAFGRDESDDAQRFLEFSLEKEKRGVFDLLDFFILKEDDEVIGVMGIVSPGYDPKEVAWICYPGIREESRNRGLGTMLLWKVIEFAKTQGVKRLYADMPYPPEGAQARSFYAKNGFVPSGEMRDFFKMGERIQFAVKYL